MSKTAYELEWKRQKQRTGLPAGHIPVHRWYLRLDEPWAVEARTPPLENLILMRAEQPTISFYRFLYHTAGEDYVWGNRRRMSDEILASILARDDTHVMVLYKSGTPVGFFEVDFSAADSTEIKYFALLPGNIGLGLGGYMLNCAIRHAGQSKLPVILDTCTLDHGSALENYLKRGFVIYDRQDEEYPDPRLDGTMPRHAGKHVPLAE
ncbi:MAG: GNAT family N-acetyltransferase [Rhizobiaceae bacterium]